MNTKLFLEDFTSMSPEQVRLQAKEFNEEQIAAILQHLPQLKSKTAKKLLFALLAGLNERASLELVGKYLNAAMFFEILENRKEIEEANHRVISPLIVGMTHQTFTTILGIISNEDLTLLQQEGYAEPLQHQLTLFSHEVANELELFLNKLRALEDQIDSLSPSSLSHRDIEAIHNAIAAAGKEAELHMHRIKNALAIGWNTNREDLIETLSFQKESWQKYDTYVIGLPQTETRGPSGLYARLYDHLNSIFSNKANPKDIEALSDEEPAIEALVKFSIWYMQDYWELGLLPEVKSLSELDLDAESHTQRERAEHRAALFSEVQKNLEKLGLRTVSDLKRNQIFSKDMLEEHIQTKMR